MSLTLEWPDNDQMAVELRHAAKTFGMSERDAASLLIGAGMGALIAEGILTRATEPMPPGQLIRRLASYLQDAENQ